MRLDACIKKLNKNCSTLCVATLKNREEVRNHKRSSKLKEFSRCGQQKKSLAIQNISSDHFEMVNADYIGTYVDKWTFLMLSI